jgi:predicted membrane protein
METIEKQPQEKIWQQWEKEHKRGKIFGGIFIVIIGSLFLARELGVVFPEWLFTWKVLLIAIGLVHLLKHGFRRVGWLIPITIGSVFLISDLHPELAIKPLIWPVLLILLGLVIIFKPRRKNKWARWQKWQKHNEKWHQYHYHNRFECHNNKSELLNEDSIEVISIMSNVKKNILTKNFKNGEVTVVLGGAKVDFSQADISDNAVLEITQVLGGTQLIIPANWEIKSEIACVLGSVEDKRPPQSTIATEENKKVLILKGTISLGGLEIKSF